MCDASQQNGNEFGYIVIVHKTALQPVLRIAG